MKRDPRVIRHSMVKLGDRLEDVVGLRDRTLAGQPMSAAQEAAKAAFEQAPGTSMANRQAASAFGL
jgi:hypothetical protein